MKEDLTRVVFRNTVANYVLMVFKFVTAVYLTRVIYLGLGQTAYGFWVLLWSVFGYSLLLDFGFGTSVQKYTAEVAVSRDFGQYNTLISTVFASYACMSALIVLGTVAGQLFLQRIFTLPQDADVLFYRKVFLYFGIGVAFTFPTGAFAEILRGLKKISLRNTIQFVTTALHVVGVSVLFRYRFGLLELALFSVAVNLLNNCAMAAACFRILPELRIRPAYFRAAYLREVFSFSFFAYIIMFANLIIYKTDQMVLGIMMSMEAVAVYQVGSRLGDVMKRLTTQFQENLLPVAASLHKAGEHERLRAILVDSNRLIAVSALVLYLILTILARPLLFLWLEVTSDVAVHTAYLLNTSMLVLILFRSGSSKVLLMADRYRLLARVATAESVANLVLSVVLIRLMGVKGVALGTLVPNLFFSLFVIFPASCRFSRITVMEYLGRVLLPLVLISAVPTAVLLGAVRYVPPEAWGPWHLVLSGGTAGLVYAVSAYFFFMNGSDKARFAKLINRAMPGKRG